MTGGDPIRLEAKYKEGESHKLFCRLLFAANFFPQSNDSSDGYFRRWIVLKFENKRDGKTAGRIDDYHTRLLTEAELSGALNKALAGREQLRQRGEFQIPESSRKALAEFRGTADHLVTFLQRRFIPDPNGHVLTTDLQQDYWDACEKARPPVPKPSKEEFGKRLKRLYGEGLWDCAITKRNVRTGPSRKEWAKHYYGLARREPRE
jgi:putative DNA primase/helicase